MKIHERCCGTTLRRRGMKLKFEQNQNIFSNETRPLSTKYSKNIAFFCIYVLSFLTILLCMELLKTIAISYETKVNFTFYTNTTIACFT